VFSFYDLFVLLLQHLLLGFCDKASFTQVRSHFFAYLSQLLQRTASCSVTKADAQKALDGSADAMVHNSLSSFVRRNIEKVTNFYEAFVQVEIPQLKQVPLTQDFVSSIIAFLTSINPNLDELFSLIRDGSNSPDKENYISLFQRVANLDCKVLLRDLHSFPSLASCYPVPSFKPPPAATSPRRPNGSSQRNNKGGFVIPPFPGRRPH